MNASTFSADKKNNWWSWGIGLVCGSIVGGGVAAWATWRYFANPHSPPQEATVPVCTTPVRQTSATMRSFKMGEIHLIAGPMRCGKSRELRRRILNHRISATRKVNKKVLVIKYNKDNRFGDNKQALVTRDGEVDQDCVATDDLEKVQSYVQDANYIFIDEGQFMGHLKDCCLAWARLGKRITISALDCDATQTIWPAIADILPYCRNKKFLCAVCDQCGGWEAATLTLTTPGITLKPGEQRIGDQEYMVVCIHCVPGQNSPIASSAVTSADHGTGRMNLVQPNIGLRVQS